MGNEISKKSNFIDPHRVQIQKQIAEANFILPQTKIIEDLGEPLHSIDWGESFSQDHSTPQSTKENNVNTQRNKNENENKKCLLKSILKKDGEQDNYHKVFNEESKFVRFCLKNKVSDSIKNKIHHRQTTCHKQVTETILRVQRQLL